jgi:general secretion pathway protein B
MSYILDALKRADAERERGHVPGLHAQPLGGTATAAPRGLAARWAWWAGGAAGLVVVAALAWRMGADTHAPVPATLAVPSAAPAAEPPATVATTPVTTTAPPVSTPPPTAAEPVALAPVAAPRAAPALPAAPASAVASRPLPAAATGTAPAPRPAAPEPALAATPANAPIPLYAQLPAGTRQQMPALAVTGSVYSDDASARFIMLNGDVAKEGSQPMPGLVVERIEPKSAVLRYKGERFRLPY